MGLDCGGAVGGGVRQVLRRPLLRFLGACEIGGWIQRFADLDGGGGVMSHTKTRRHEGGEIKRGEKVAKNTREEGEDECVSRELGSHEGALYQPRATLWGEGYDASRAVCTRCSPQSLNPRATSDSRFHECLKKSARGEIFSDLGGSGKTSA